jgi:histidinol-phosphatase (PHP family)
MKKIADMHVHSTFSIDADDNLGVMCKKALEKGLFSICFTEHLDLNQVDEGYGFFRKEDFFKEIQELQIRYGNELKVLKGIEFSEPHLYGEELKKQGEQGYDVVIGAIHFIDDIFVGWDELLDKYTPGEIYEKYFELVLETVRYGGFDVLAHLDFPKKYLKCSYQYNGTIEEILETIITKGIVLEINTASFRKGLNESIPGETILKRYSQLGGKRVTLGSDAHRRNEIAADFSKIEGLIEVYNLEVGYFQNRDFKSL